MLEVNVTQNCLKINTETLEDRKFSLNFILLNFIMLHLHACSIIVPRLRTM